jgi:hypothetical protein
VVLLLPPLVSLSCRAGRSARVGVGAHVNYKIADTWAVCIDPGYRMPQRARSADTEAQKDDFYAIAARQARLEPGAVGGFDPSACHWPRP